VIFSAASSFAINDLSDTFIYLPLFNTTIIAQYRTKSKSENSNRINDLGIDGHFE
jgi:hypothetical protein